MMSLFQVSTDQAIEQSNSYNIQKAEMNALLSSPGHLGGNDDDLIGERQPAAASFGTSKVCFSLPLFLFRCVWAISARVRNKRAHVSNGNTTRWVKKTPALPSPPTLALRPADWNVAVTPLDQLRLDVDGVGIGDAVAAAAALARLRGSTVTAKVAIICPTALLDETAGFRLPLPVLRDGRLSTSFCHLYQLGVEEVHLRTDLPCYTPATPSSCELVLEIGERFSPCPLGCAVPRRPPGLEDTPVGPHPPGAPQKCSGLLPPGQPWRTSGVTPGMRDRPHHSLRPNPPAKPLRPEWAVPPPPLPHGS